MKMYSIEPRDSSLFRDARPFEGNAGAVSMAAPWPSTVAGLFRTLQGLDANGKWTGNADEARKLAVSGPWLVQLNDNGDVVDHFVPAPMDAVFFSEKEPPFSKKEKLTRRQLAPRAEFSASLSDLPAGLTPVAFANTDNPGKAGSGPAWWRWSAMMEWLETAEHPNKDIEFKQIGLAPLLDEDRVHVAIDPATGTADDGKLFATSMRRFVVRNDGGTLTRYALAAMSNCPVQDHVLTPFGGERRLATIRAAGEAPKAPNVDGAKRLRVTLVTPAIFIEGWRPNSDHLGQGRLVGAIIGRPQSVSGWDYANGGPKPARRMVQAGAVYWLDFESTELAKKWADEHHLKSICDNEQDRLDGFGLILVGRG